MTSGTLSRLLYVDDSGSPNDGCIVYGWVECGPAEWRLGLRRWLEFRKKLLRDYAIPVTQELHATKYVNGRTHISTNPPARFIVNGDMQWKKFGREVAILCLKELRDSPHLKVGAVHRISPNRANKAYHEDKGTLYGDLIKLWDEEHRKRNDYVLVGMDGDGSDPKYFEAHRSIALDTRHIIEDPMFHDSSRSQWTQMADLIAYVAYLKIARTPGKEFGWDWYDDYLAPKDPAGAPLPI